MVQIILFDELRRSVILHEDVGGLHGSWTVAGALVVVSMRMMFVYVTMIVMMVMGVRMLFRLHL